MRQPAYVVFQIRHALFPLLNVGVSANPCGFEGEGVVHLDLDRWNHPGMVQGDAHHLPFKADSFASVVCGDVFEHLLDPAQALREMRRVAPRIVLTTFEEWRLPGTGQHLAESEVLFEPGAEANRQADLAAGRVFAWYPNTRLPHQHHINQFTLEGLLGLFTQSGLRVVRQEEDCPGVHEGHPMKNWMFVLER